MGSRAPVKVAVQGDAFLFLPDALPSPGSLTSSCAPHHLSVAGDKGLEEGSAEALSRACGVLSCSIFGSPSAGQETLP